MIIGVVGQNCSGKDTVASILSEKGFNHIDLGDLVRKEAKSRGLSTDREVIIPIANEIRAKEGPGAWAERACNIIKSGPGNWVVSSIRHPKEVEILRELPDFKLLRVTAPVAIRYERAKRRGRDKLPPTINGFIKKESIENKKSGDNVQRISDCEALADITIDNSGSLNDLRIKLYEIMGW